MKKLILLFALFVGLSAFAQNPVLLTEPGSYTLTIENWTRTDSAPVYIAGKGEFIISDSRFSGSGAVAFIEVARRQLFGGDFPALTVINTEFEGIGKNLPEFVSLPWCIEAGGANSGGLKSLVFEHNEIKNCAGVRWKRGPAGVKNSSISYNNFDQLNGRISNGNGGHYTYPQLKAKGKKPSQFTRHAIAVGRLFAGPAKEIKIEWNIIDSEDGPHQTDIVNLSLGVDPSTIVMNGKEATYSGVRVLNNLVRGNYIEGFATQDQPGCAFIYDNQPNTVGGALFKGNYAIACSNSPFQHAAYGAGWWVENVCIGRGFYKNQKIAYCSRGFGLYHGNPTRAVSDDIRFYRNLSGYMNTRNGVRRNDYVTKGVGGRVYPAKFIPFDGANANLRHKAGQTITKADEDFFYNEYLAKAQAAGITIGKGSNSGGGGIDPQELEDLRRRILDLQAQLDKLHAAYDSIAEMNSSLHAVLDSIRKIVK